MCLRCVSIVVCVPPHLPLCGARSEHHCGSERSRRVSVQRLEAHPARAVVNSAADRVTTSTDLSASLSLTLPLLCSLAAVLL